MLNTFEIYQELKANLDANTAETLTKILSRIYEDVRNTVTREDFSKLRSVVEEPAGAQRKTQKRIDVISERVEGVSNTFGYALGDIIYRRLPSLLAMEGIKMHGRIVRRYCEREGKYNQINIYAHIEEEGKHKLLLGEVKVLPSKKEIDRFIKIAAHIRSREDEGKDRTWEWMDTQATWDR